jgi:uncharacterized protein YkwD
MSAPRSLWPAVLCGVLAANVSATALAASLVDSVNTIRQRGCGGQPGVKTPLRAERSLDAVARQWSRGGRLSDAFTRTDYRMVNSASIRFQGSADERALLDLLARNYCDVIRDASLSEIGVHRSGRDTWIVLAAPFRAPSAKDAGAVSQEVLKHVNAARAQARKCGRQAFAAAPPLSLSPALERAAKAHANDMARHSLFEHKGSDGSAPADRVTRAGYTWRTVAENIAAGAPDAQSVVQGWLDSPGHCANLMGAQYREMGVAYTVNEKSKSGIYWAQVFATPR